MAYQIETVIAGENGMFFTFWGSVTLLKEKSTNKVFSKYYIKSKNTPSVPSGWELQSYTFNPVKKVVLKKDETIDKVEDNLGNSYYEVTSII